MSEEKIVQHTKKAINIVENRTHTWKHKFKELTEEAIIIIFAVSVTLAFHNWNDWRNERKMEKEFLEGTSADLKVQASNLDKSLTELSKTVDYYNTVWGQINSKKIDTAYVDNNSFQLINTVYFNSNNGRFESFESSGYLRLIENKELLNHITTMYATYLPFQVNADNDLYRDRRRDFVNYVGIKAPVDANKTVHVSKVINDPAVRYHFMFYGEFMQERLNVKKNIVVKMRKLAAEIDKELEQ